jgi:hypothetical protein
MVEFVTLLAMAVLQLPVAVALMDIMVIRRPVVHLHTGTLQLVP